MSTDPQKELFKRAADIASVVPETMQEAAFERALDMLQEEGGHGTSRRSKSGGRPTKQRSRAASTKTGSADAAAVLKAEIDRTKHPEVGDEEKVLERALHVLKIAKDEFDIDGLSANEIAGVLTDKFRIRTTRQRVNQVLDDAATLVDRTTAAGMGGARYRIMAPGEKHLSQPRADRKETAAPPTQRPRPARRRRRSTANGGGGTRKASTQRRRRRLGPRAAIEELINDGYLDQPRTIGELRDRLESKKGRTFKVTDLSPTMTRMLRDGALDREKNDAGQYEYQRK
jgi:hypothetical protein